MNDTFDPKDYINNPLPDESGAASQFSENIVDLEDLPSEKQEEYASYFEGDSQPVGAEPTQADKADAVREVMSMVEQEEAVELTDDMREAFIRSLMSNKPYSWTYDIYEDKMSITFRSLTVKEYDAIADAVAKVSQESGFVNQGHLRFVNYRYTVSSAVESIKTTDENGDLQIFNYKSPLVENTATHREEVMEIQQLDGTTKEKTVTKEITDADRVLEAHTERFDAVNSTLYNVILNTYARFDREINALAAELYQKNFTAPIRTS